MPSEGYIKFSCDWSKANPLPQKDLAALNKWRDRLRTLGFIGVYDEGVGFGNISTRIRGTDEFIITGSATGNLKQLSGEHYTKVIGFDFTKNYLKCIGPIKASSESLSHAIIYAQDQSIGAVIHIHSKELWKKLLDTVPTTSRSAEYGTPEMAWEIERLFKETNLKKLKILVMAGHEEGIITFGRDLDEAGSILLSCCNTKNGTHHQL
jgi:L-ribulose-5-phosphate 4-epimerase